MKFIQAVSSNPSISEAISEIKGQFLSILDPAIVLYFVSVSYDVEELSMAMKEAFPAAETLGCTTSGELVSGKMLNNSVVAMALGKEGIADFRIEVLENINESPYETVNMAFKNFENHFGAPVETLDFEKYVGILLVDGLSMSEEKVNDAIGNLTNISFVGGSAGDDLQFKNTYVFYNGRTYEHTAVVALLKPVSKFSILKTQSFEVLPQTLIVTKALEHERRVIEFNDKPATLAYAEALGVPVEELQQNFFKYPVGMVLDESEPFVRSPRIIEGTDILFYCNMKEGTTLHLLKSKDIVEETRTALARKLAEMGNISGIINFNCILRTLELQNKNQTQSYGDLFSDFHTVGFSTYGENYIGFVNQTATMLVFE